MFYRIALALLPMVSFAACRSTTAPTTALRTDLGTFHRAVTTDSPQAQQWFDQGLLLVYGFDHELAIRSFERALEFDPSFAMAHWGAALAAGPNINNPTMDREAMRAAAQRVATAQTLARGLRPVERALIDALARRYADPPPADPRQLDIAYADAMRAVYRAHPADADVGALFAEALMDLRPWDLWTPDGHMQPGTEEIIAVLEDVLAGSPRHPGANHYYIHTMEASPQPQRALAAADRLGDLAPGASHLVHMPAHIYQRLGRYADAIRANQHAVAVDRAHRASTERGGFYALYRAHNQHFLAWSAMYDGQSQIALTAARGVGDEVPAELVAQMPDFLEGFLDAPLMVLMRFGRWDEILSEPRPAADFHVANALWRHARGIALAAGDRIDAAEAELLEFRAEMRSAPLSRAIGNNPAHAVLAIAEAMLVGEILFRRGQLDDAFARLREAVRAEDALRYDEPWGWMTPVRHALGALLLQAERFGEAEAVYREDLRRNPENGWSLFGLAECLRRSGRDGEAAAMQARFTAAWARADTTIRASCFCASGD